MSIELLLKSMVCEMFAVEHSVMRVDTSNTDFNAPLVILIDTDSKFRQREVKGECVDWNKHVCRQIKRLMKKLVPFGEVKVCGRYTKNFPETIPDVLNYYRIDGAEAVQMASTIEYLRDKYQSREYIKENNK